MAEADQDTASTLPKRESPWAVNGSLIPLTNPRKVYIEPDTKGYRVMVMLGNIFQLASLAAWLVLLIALIFLVISIMNSFEALIVLREQGIYLNETYGPHQLD